ncbi:uncharacterized protein LOC127782503 isoform X7 [Oryza glaberrima]|uniref:uncharacterized protein LOC127782503 isoform X7 n=1 Tax=Oryza glaberrima TaxID=4538 RepID=UPI00224C271A|nr:uncharacterized protein LOC127782503 isoform X7 [Oryza glaberrima]
MLDRPSSLTGQFRDCWRCSSSQNPIRRRPLLPLVSRSPSPSRSPAAVAASVSAFPSRRRLCLRRRGRVHLRGRRVGVSERRRRRRGEQPSPPRSPPSPSAAAARRLLRPPASGSGLHVVGDADLTAVHALGSVSSSAVAEHRHFRLHLALALSSAAAAAPVLRCRCHRRAPLLGPSPPSPTAAAPSSVAAAIEDTTLVTEPASMKAVAAARRGEPHGNTTTIVVPVVAARTAYNLALHEHGPKLYDKLTEDMEDHLQEMCVSIEAAQGGLKIIDRFSQESTLPYYLLPFVWENILACALIVAAE